MGAVPAPSAKAALASPRSFGTPSTIAGIAQFPPRSFLHIFSDAVTEIHGPLFGVARVPR